MSEGGVREMPILFSTDMVKATLDDRKTQTRRVIKYNFLPGFNPEWTGYIPVFENGEFFLIGSNGEPATKPVKCPLGEPGDVLWVRETWAIDDYMTINPEYIYKADDGFYPEGGWRPSIHMPREAARLFLTVKEVRVERLQDISEEDAMAEGVKTCPSGGYVFPGTDYDKIGLCHSDPIVAFQIGWDMYSEKRGHGWATNPYVWITSFERKVSK